MLQLCTELLMNRELCFRLYRHFTQPPKNGERSLLISVQTIYRTVDFMPNWWNRRGNWLTHGGKCYFWMKSLKVENLFDSRLEGWRVWALHRPIRTSDRHNNGTADAGFERVRSVNRVLLRLADFEQRILSVPPLAQADNSYHWLKLCLLWAKVGQLSSRQVLSGDPACFDVGNFVAENRLMI